MLARGGNAVYAVLATAITLTVVEPCMNGIGGDAFAIIWDGIKMHGLNASGCAPKKWTPEYFSRYEAMPVRGWDSVTVPGTVSAWRGLSDRFGDDGGHRQDALSELPALGRVLRSSDSTT